MTTTYLLELITDVKLVGVKEQQYEVTPCRKPAADVDEVVGAFNALLLSRQHPRRVYKSHFFQQLVGTAGSLKLGKETVAILCKTLEQNHVIVKENIIQYTPQKQRWVVDVLKKGRWRERNNSRQRADACSASLHGVVPICRSFQGLAKQLLPYWARPWSTTVAGQKNILSQLPQGFAMMC